MSAMNDEEAIRLAVVGATSKKEVLQNLGVKDSSARQRQLNDACDKFGILLPVYSGHSATRPFTRTLEEILVEDSTYTSRDRLKKRLISEGKLENLCAACGLAPEWNGQPLMLQLDHINGVSNDHRIENLRFLCPNCHTQTDTYCGRNLRKGKTCADCNRGISPRFTRCRACASGWDPAKEDSLTKIDWPSCDSLVLRLESEQYGVVASDLGVTANAIRKHLRARGVEPPRKYKPRAS